MNLGLDYLNSLLQDDKEKGIFRCKREMFTDPRLFDLEMEHLFEGNWLYVAHESQIAQNNDYYTTYMGRQPIVIARNKAGELNAFINACSHRGAMLCRFKSGNKATYTCPFHGWTFNNSGKLLKVKDPKHAGYPDSFDCDGSHDLKKVARFESYRGFLFASLRADVAPLEVFLGESKKIIDMVVDQSADGLEVLRGSSTYVYEGNWKLQAENGADGYHVSAVHWNYAATQQQRKLKEAGDDIRAMSAGGWGKKGGGFYSFEHGHLLLWTRWDNPEDRPMFAERDRLAGEFGEARADWMIGNSRNLCLYPNLYLMDQFGSQLRVARPDDLEEFRACQQGFAGRAMEWNDMSRGSEHWVDGADESAKEIDLHPLMSGMRTEDEGLFVLQHTYWQQQMIKALTHRQDSMIHVEGA